MFTDFSRQDAELHKNICPIEELGREKDRTRSLEKEIDQLKQQLAGEERQKIELSSSAEIIQLLQAVRLPSSLIISRKYAFISPPNCRISTL